MQKGKKAKSGKVRRHQFRKSAGIKKGFGKPWSAPSLTYRCEFSWENPDGTEENEQVHWVECRKFKGEEKSFLRAHYEQHAEEWVSGETIESKFVCVYCSLWIVENKEKSHLNQCFIFPTTKKGNETIRNPIYQIKWSENLAKHSVWNDGLKIVLQNSIYHNLS